MDIGQMRDRENEGEISKGDLGLGLFAMERTWV